MPKLPLSVVNIVLAAIATSSPFPMAYVSPSGMVTIAPDSKTTIQIASGSEPDLSPDGKSVVFWSKGENPGMTNLVIADIATRQKKTALIANIRRPQYSPDGTKILFAMQQSNAWRPTTILSNGSGQPQAILAEDGSNPAWLPNGKSFIWTTLLGIKEIDLAGKETWSRPKPGPENTTPVWNDRFSPHPTVPDSFVFSRLVVNDDQTLSRRIYITNPTQTLHEIPTENYPAFDPIWFKDGTGIIFTIKGSDGKPYIAQSNPDGTGFTVLFAGSQPAQ